MLCHILSFYQALKQHCELHVHCSYLTGEEAENLEMGIYLWAVHRKLAAFWHFPRRVVLLCLPAGTYCLISVFNECLGSIIPLDHIKLTMEPQLHLERTGTLGIKENAINKFPSILQNRGQIVGWMRFSPMKALSFCKAFITEDFKH